MQKIIYMRADGSVSVVHPVRNTMGETLTTDAEIEQRAWAKLPTDAINPRFVDASAIPTDRTFRDAWVASGQSITHDMEKCRALHRRELRALRAPKLAALDVEYQRADERGDAAQKKAIAARKQILRDVTTHPDIDAAVSPGELKAVIPSVLL